MICIKPLQRREDIGSGKINLERMPRVLVNFSADSW